MMAGKTLLLRADANARMGSGHVMRCFAFAQAWRDAGGRAVFVMATRSEALEALVRSERIGWQSLTAAPGSDEDAAQTLDVARAHGAGWAAIDGYHFGAAYHRALQGAGLRVVAIDDDGRAGPYGTEWILNQNLYAQETLYAQRESSTKLLLGTRHVLLRREWAARRGWKRQTAEVARRVLVTLGGGDPDNVTLKVIHALQQAAIEGLEVEVIVGACNPHEALLQRALREARTPIRLRRHVTTMSDSMAWADLAISAVARTCR